MADQKDELTSSELAVHLGAQSEVSEVVVLNRDEWRVLLSLLQDQAVHAGEPTLECSPRKAA
jgi:hypothetical protein